MSAGRALSRHIPQSHFSGATTTTSTSRTTPTAPRKAAGTPLLPLLPPPSQHQQQQRRQQLSRHHCGPVRCCVLTGTTDSCFMHHSVRCPAGNFAGPPTQHGSSYWPSQLRHLQRCTATAVHEGVQPLAQGTFRLRLCVAYDGSSFAGFQWQPKERTVQAELERAASRVLLPAGRVVGASRTDAGAHATGQVAHVDVTGSPDSIAPGSLLMAFNGVLPPEVKLQALDVAPPGFDAHFASVGKTYDYHLDCSGTPQPFQAKQVWWVHDRWCQRARGKPQAPSDLQLDVVAMREAAAHLLGTHDFSSFADIKRPSGLGNLKRKKPRLAVAGIKPVRTAAKNTRTLWRADVEQPSACRVVIHLAGSGFLYRMVRLIAAGLVEVGHGRINPEQFRRVLAAGDRAALAVDAAPPHGLYLTEVLYELPLGVILPAAASPAAEAAEDDDDEVSAGGKPASNSRSPSDAED